MIAVLSGGVGAARLLAGLVQVRPPAELTAIVNVGDDVELHGLHISPDLDTITYTVAGAIDPERGWGLRDESWRAMEALARYPDARSWFNLGDQDLATHLYRTDRMRAGAPLSTVTAEIAAVVVAGAAAAARLRRPGAHDRHGPRRRRAGPRDRLPGVLRAAPPRRERAIRPLRRRVGGPPRAGRARGAGLGVPGGDRAVQPDRVDRPGARSARRARRRRRPAGRRGRRVADHRRCRAEGPGRPPAARAGPRGVGGGDRAHLYAPLAATLVVDDADAASADEVEAAGMRCVVAPTIMSGPAESAALAEVVLS